MRLLLSATLHVLALLPTPAFAQVYVDPPLDVVRGTVSLPDYRERPDSPEFPVLGIRKIRIRELCQQPDGRVDSLLVLLEEYGRNGYRSGLFVAEPRYAERTRTRVAGNKLRKQVVIWKSRHYPKMVHQKTRYRYRDGTPVRRIQRNVLVTHFRNDRQSVDRRRHLSTFHYRPIGVPGAKYARVFQQWLPRKRKYAHEDAEVSVFDSADRLQMRFSTRDYAVDGSSPEAAAVLDSLLRNMPSRFNDLVLAKIAWNESLPDAFYKLPEVFDEATDSLSDAWERSIESVEAFNHYDTARLRSYFDRFVLFDYSADKKLKRRVYLEFDGLIELTGKDSLAYDSAGGIHVWDSWLFRPKNATGWSGQRDSGTLRSLWNFSYDSAGRVDSASHQIWHSPPPAWDSFYHKATEHFIFRYNGDDRRLCSFSKSREDYDRGNFPDRHVVASETQEFLVDYEYFTRTAGATGLKRNRLKRVLEAFKRISAKKGLGARHRLPLCLRRHALQRQFLGRPVAIPARPAIADQRQVRFGAGCSIGSHILRF